MRRQTLVFTDKFWLYHQRESAKWRNIKCVNIQHVNRLVSSSVNLSIDAVIPKGVYLQEWLKCGK